MGKVVVGNNFHRLHSPDHFALLRNALPQSNQRGFGPHTIGAIFGRASAPVSPKFPGLVYSKKDKLSTFTQYLLSSESGLCSYKAPPVKQ